MKKSLFVVALGLLALGGCVAVPVYDSPPAYGYYVPPPARFSFGYYYGADRYRHGYRYRYRY